MCASLPRILRCRVGLLADKDLQILKRGEGDPRKELPRMPPLPEDNSKNIIPVYCSILAAVVVGLLAYVAFKWYVGREALLGGRRPPLVPAVVRLTWPEGLRWPQARGRLGACPRTPFSPPSFGGAPIWLLYPLHPSGRETEAQRWGATFQRAPRESVAEPRSPHAGAHH